MRMKRYMTLVNATVPIPVMGYAGGLALLYFPYWCPAYAVTHPFWHATKVQPHAAFAEAGMKHPKDNFLSYLIINDNIFILMKNS